jgi:hypothetical protein
LSPRRRLQASCEHFRCTGIPSRRRHHSDTACCRTAPARRRFRRVGTLPHVNRGFDPTAPSYPPPATRRRATPEFQDRGIRGLERGLTAMAETRAASKPSRFRRRAKPTRPRVDRARAGQESGPSSSAGSEWGMVPGRPFSIQLASRHRVPAARTRRFRNASQRNNRRGSELLYPLMQGYGRRSRHELGATEQVQFLVGRSAPDHRPHRHARSPVLPRGKR